MHCPEQHWLELEQVSPRIVQLVTEVDSPWQTPLTHELLQQLVDDVQAPPSFTQTLVVPHWLLVASQ